MILPPRKFTNPRAKHNFQGRTCSIISVGSYVPSRTVTNQQLATMVNTSDEWIVTRTGIRERHIAAKGEFTSDMAARAAMKALERARISPEQVDLIIVATITPDMPFPSTACLVQQKIGAKRAAAFDLKAACSGFIYALEVGQQFVMSRSYDTVLVIGAEKLSSVVNWSDRNTCVLFGDGAGAAVLQNRPNSHGLLTACMGADGAQADVLCLPGGGCKTPPSHESLAAGLHYLKMDGKETYKHAVTAMYAAAQEALRRCDLQISQIKLVVPPPGQHAHHRSCGRPTQDQHRPVLYQPRQIRQHLRRLGGYRIGRSRPLPAHRTGRLGSDGRVWSWFYLGALPLSNGNSRRCERIPNLTPSKPVLMLNKYERKKI